MTFQLHYIVRFLRVVDRFNSLLVSAFITPGGTVMLLLHNGRAPEESVRSFFTEASELFAKHIMNPFAIVGNNYTTSFHRVTLSCVMIEITQFWHAILAELSAICPIDLSLVLFHSLLFSSVLIISTYISEQHVQVHSKGGSSYPPSVHLHVHTFYWIFRLPYKLAFTLWLRLLI